MAIGFLKAMQAGNVRCPRDFSIIGFDGIDFGAYCEPALTTIRQPRFDIGATATRFLIDEMAGRGGDARKTDQLQIHTLKSELLVRESCRSILSD